MDNVPTEQPEQPSANDQPAPQPQDEQPQAAPQQPVQPIQTAEVQPNPYAEKVVEVAQETKKKRKKVRVRTSGFALFFLISVVLIGIAGAFFYLSSQDKVNEYLKPLAPIFEFIEELTGGTGNGEVVTPEEPEPEPQPSTEIITTTSGGWVEKDIRKYEFSISYPEEATFVGPGVTNQDVDIYSVIFGGANQDGQIVENSDLDEGYIVRVAVFPSVQNKDLNNITLQKRNSLLIACPETANFSNIDASQIAGAEARVFEVTNCGQNYVYSLAIKEGTLYEITQIYKGDIGYDQVLRRTTDEIVDKFSFTNIIAPSPKETWALFGGGRQGFSFNYPKELDPTCCTVDGPISSSTQKLIVLADPNSVVTTKSKGFNGFGVFADGNPDKISFEEYLETQKNLLKENYTVVVGRASPEMSERVINVGGVNGVLLEGYAWWGDLFLVPVPESNTIVIFSATEVNDGEMDSLFNEVLSTFQP